MLDLDVVSIYILTIALVALVFGVFINHQQKSGKAVSIWLTSTLLGVLLGAGGSMGLCYFMGYEVSKSDLPDPEARVDDPMSEEEAALENDGPPGRGEGSGRGGAGRGGSSGRGGSGRGGSGRGGSRQLPARFQLAMLVRKLDLLTGDIAIQLSPEQSRDVGDLLREIDAAETMTDETAKSMHDALMALMEDSQKTKTAAVSLPAGRGGNSREGGRATSAGGSRGSGGSTGNSETNPFHAGSSKESLQSLLQRLGAGNQPDAPGSE